MKFSLAAMMMVAAPAFSLYSAETAPPRPKAGPVEIMKLAEVKPGMKAVAWTVFSGSAP